MSCFDELDYVCAWGRWSIDQARNDAVHPEAPQDSVPVHRERVTVPRSRVRRGRARLRLVDRPVGLVR